MTGTKYVENVCCIHSWKKANIRKHFSKNTVTSSARRLSDSEKCPHHHSAQALLGTLKVVGVSSTPIAIETLAHTL
ncbi:hypothetical protein SK128_000108 [Halocaridina rubra]|uniref:Uncharacterized protein n=1 Tax=Halocaridina rubra TaxID=373956 RepID=A0AAN8X172_HALRR